MPLCVMDINRTFIIILISVGVAGSMVGIYRTEYPLELMILIPNNPYRLIFILTTMQIPYSGRMVIAIISYLMP